MDQPVKTELELAQDKIKELEGTISALKGMLGQFIPVINCLMPLLKDRPQINQQIVAQIEKVTQIATMMISMDTGNVSKE